MHFQFIVTAFQALELKFEYRVEHPVSHVYLSTAFRCLTPRAAGRTARPFRRNSRQQDGQLNDVTPPQHVRGAAPTVCQCAKNDERATKSATAANIPTAADGPARTAILPAAAAPAAGSQLHGWSRRPPDVRG